MAGYRYSRFSMRCLMVGVTLGAGIAWAYTQWAGRKTTSAANIVSGDNFVGVVLLTPDITSFSYDRLWRPAVRDVVRAEQGIQRFLGESAPDFKPELNRYIRQYVGFEINDRKKIYCNLLHEELFEWGGSGLFYSSLKDITDNLIDIYDAADRAIVLVYDVDSGTCSQDIE